VRPRRDWNSSQFPVRSLDASVCGMLTSEQAGYIVAVAINPHQGMKRGRTFRSRYSVIKLPYLVGFAASGSGGGLEAV